MAEQPKVIDPTKTPCAICGRTFGIIQPFTLDDDGNLVHVRCHLDAS